MDIQFYGANCIVISNKQTRIVIDDTLQKIGGQSVVKPGDIALFTHDHPGQIAGAKMTIDVPGEYEMNGVNIYGLQSRAHVDTESERNAVMYKIVSGETKILVTGHVYPKLSEAKLEDIGLVDVMIIPAGGNGFTLDAEGASHIIKAVEPKVVIPTHYEDKALNYDVPQQPLDSILTVLGMEPKETTKKYQFKPSDAAESTQLVILEKS